MNHNRPIVRLCRLPATSPFQPQYIRPLQADISSQSVLHRLQEETNDFNVLSASSLSTLAPEIIRPSAAPVKEAFIENGWQEKRFRFFMEVELESAAYATKYAMITGFTNHGDISIGGNIDPDMHLYINSVITYVDSRIIHKNSGGASIQRTLNGNSQIIQPISHQSMAGHSLRLRPYDVVSNMAVQGMADDAGMVVNTVGSQHTVAQASRDRMIPSMYLSNVLKGSITAAKTSMSVSNGFEDGQDTYFNEFVGSVKDVGFTNNAFTALLMRNTQYPNSGYVTWRELVSLFPELQNDRTTQIELPRPGEAINYMNTEHHRGFGVENQCLAVVQNMLPSIMSMFMLQQVTFVLSNETHTGQPELVMNSVAPMTDKVDARSLVTAFQNQIIHQLAPAVSAGNMMRYTITVSCNFLTVMHLKVRMNGSHMVEFAVPLYADSTYTAFGYGTQKDLDSITHELTSLTHAVESMLDPSHFATAEFQHPVGNAAPAAQQMGGDPLDNSTQFDSWMADPLQQSNVDYSSQVQNSAGALVMPSTDFSTDPL